MAIRGVSTQTFIDTFVPYTGAIADVDLGTFDFTTNSRVGARNYSLGDYFVGQLDELRIYNRALSASEVLALYLKG